MGRSDADTAAAVSNRLNELSSCATMLTRSDSAVCMGLSDAHRCEYELSESVQTGC